ncbi:hypothetical protein WYO_5487 [Methylobacterium sp. GXF4]|uniref:hypothetical protein n=1 Tax=Methylobacterium sp. GXF4 TaxID=1096546 RepID=UPI000269AA17|nr:hypothetical protein [Methylobacterium sp. GXF4]EIZ81899.1 hypothetical protein WYO_5487 [Methylobacterium sp. GXF4]
MPQTLTGWILFAAVMASAMATAATTTKLGMARRGRAALDRRDIHAAYAFGLLLALSTVLFLLVEGR